MTSPPPVGGARASGSDSDSFDHGRFAPGTRLGDRYRIVGRLGVGGMGEVYRADDLKLGQPVALKFLPEEFERDPLRLDKLMAEIRTARQISHPNVCRVYDVGEVDGRRFLTMEYVDGEDLRGLLRRIGRLPEDKGLEIARQICAGLAAIHDRGVLHRDLKPANVMLDGRGRVRLTDFGLATAAAAAGRDGEIAGTPAYMAPEQLAGQPLSVATDLYALGLVLFELFTGERVHKTDRLDDARAGKHAKGATVSLTTSGSGAKLDPMIQRVIERCVDTDPKRRPQSAIVIAAALPGGDPLAAALAAGETPSPQMVAASGGEGGLSFKVAVPWLIALLLGTVNFAWQQTHRSVPAMVAFPLGPEVLASKAGEMLMRLGYTEGQVDSAAGFGSTDFWYSQWIKEHDQTTARWQHVRRLRPSLIYYWRRTSPSKMEPQSYFSDAGPRGGGLAVGPNDPPRIVPGMTYIELDPEGRLTWFDAVPPEKRLADAAAAAPDWPAFFREAGLDLAAFSPVAPEWTSRVESDASAAWSGPGADPSGAMLRVEAAALRGRLVFFRVLAPWQKPAEVGSPEAAQDRGAVIIAFVIVVVVPVGAIGLSLRNLRLGRTDTRGAIRVAAFFGTVVALAAALSSSVTAGQGWINTGVMIGSWAGFCALLIAAFYAAIEPYVRRHWPRMLIAWSRLLDGRWRDPLVGRDVLIGAALAMAVRSTEELRLTILEMRGTPSELPSFQIGGWMDSRLALGQTLAWIPGSVWVSLGVVVLLVLFRMVLRRELAAGLGVGALFMALNVVAPGAGHDWLITILFGLFSVVPLIVIPTRFGLVMFVAFMFTGRAASGLASPAFATGALVLSMIAMVAPGVFGFYTATRGRKASGWLDA
jgi:serine/threonine-protein kinase